ncbi:MAG: hypothetical protein KBD05_02630 [Candidatus Pacebacteria bacterium]|nr:hypothetical protein [Candidatus Paceibacterota bacterium]
MESERARQVREIAEKAITGGDLDMSPEGTAAMVAANRAAREAQGGDRAQAVREIAEQAITGGDLDMSPEGTAAMIEANRRAREAANENDQDSREEAA